MKSLPIPDQITAAWRRPVCTCKRWAQSCRPSISGADNAGDDSVYNCNIFLPWLPSNVLINALVLSLIPQEMVEGRDLLLFTAAHIKESPAMQSESPERACWLHTHHASLPFGQKQPGKHKYIAVAVDNSLALARRLTFQPCYLIKNGFFAFLM